MINGITIFVPFLTKQQKGSERVRARILDIKVNLRQPWLLCVLLIAVIPIFPEYICPLLAAGALIAAHFDAKARRRDLVVGGIGKLLLIYIAYMAVTIIFSDNPFNSVSTVLMWIAAFAAYVSLATVLSNRHRFDTALFCITLIAGVVGFIACMQYVLRAWFDVNVSMYFWQWIDLAIYRYFPMPLLLDLHELRAASTFNNPNVMAEYLIMVIPFASYYAFSGLRKSTRLLSRFCLLFALFGVAFSFSRGSYLALLVIVAVFCMANIRKWSIILLGGVSILALIPSSVLDRLMSVGSMDNSISERFRIWTVSFGEIARNPLFGSGPGIQNFWDVLMTHGISAPHTHNLVLQLLVEGGLIALVLMMLIGWRTFRNGFQMLKCPQEGRMLGVAFIGFVGAFIMYGMVDFPFLCPKLVTSFMMVMGISDCASRVYLDQRVQALTSLVPSGTDARTAVSAAFFKTK